MSIKPKYLPILKDKFLRQNPRYKYIIDKEREVAISIRNEIEDYTKVYYKPEELRVLQELSGFITFVYYNVGRGFEDPVSKYYCYYSLNLEIPRIFIKQYSNYNFEITNPRVKEIFEDINRKYYELEKERSDIEELWERYINKNTSLIWLKSNFPEIWKYLKSLTKQ